MLDILLSLHWIVILLAVLIYFFLGALWYSPVLFASSWMKLRNINEDDIDKPNPIIFLYSFILQLIAVTCLALFIFAMGVYGAIDGAIVGFGAGAGLVFTLSGTTGIFSDIPLKLHLIDNGYHVIGLTLAGLLIGIWS